MTRITLPSSTHKTRHMFTTAIALYGLALLQNILLPLGYPSIVLTGILSFLGSLVLLAAIMLPRLEKSTSSSSPQKKPSKQ